MVDKKYSIGIDIGGTKMYAILFNGEKIIADSKLATSKDSLENFLVMLKALIEPLLDRARIDRVKIAGIGIGIPGEVDKKTGKLYGSPNIPILNGEPIEKLIENSLKMPIVVDNDANVFILGEIMVGAAKKYKNVYGLTLGTGIGGAWWINNNVYHGAFGGGNEAGHMITDLSSGLDFEKSYHHLTQNNPAKLSQEAIFGDPLAIKAFEEFGQHLGAAFANIINLLDPEAIILGGSVMDSADLFLSSAKKTMQQFVLLPFSANNVKILKSKLKEDAGAIGAALLVK